MGSMVFASSIPPSCSTNGINFAIFFFVQARLQAVKEELNKMIVDGSKQVGASKSPNSLALVSHAIWCGMRDLLGQACENLAKV